MSRNRSSSKQRDIKTNIEQPCKSWIFLLKEEIIDESASQSDIVTLRHPSTGEAAIFLFTEGNKSVHEVLTYSEDKRSWFIDGTVKSDGKFKISTPIDPIFLMLPYLKKNCSEKALLLDQILHDEKYPEVERLLNCEGLKYLTSISDKKISGDIVAYKYNEEKTLVMLKKKIDNLVKILKQKNIHLASDAISATFKKVHNEEEIIDNNIYIRYAVGIVSDYLDEDLSQKLLKYMKLPEEVPQIKRKSDVIDVRDTKKTKLDNEDPLKKTPKPAAKLAKLPSVNPKNKAKASHNTRSITSFFKKV
ncbi:hypothetical protein Trydic_g13505 [Trypoxylus dichotomus]